MRVYIDRADWWIGYYRGPNHHYVCPLPTVVIRWKRRSADTDGGATACGCFACIGNKRCPHGTDHRNKCTGSNEPGQSGSRYGGL